MNPDYVFWTVVYHKKSEPLDPNSFYNKKNKSVFKYSTRREAAYVCAERNSKLKGDSKYSTQKFYDYDAEKADLEELKKSQQRKRREMLIRQGH
ncbi:hypothetical protein EC431_11175 [Salmonella enterica subsp. enterica serovar Braenderup]|uniref:Uncharacterized protein n=3 Tax=Salmonella enterica TaxID=28901 RepID=A0A5U1KI98_SALER|nr:hypothetical protein [Salmonella enterica]ASO33586.1 hypothetical protein CHC44_12880 [Salmonella enterica subsp. enterica serovar Braenderup]EAW1398287.1 hypothetical protein [Salmonella enterica subsp. enterica]EAY2271524.1 hypothetical protein [Salmonella enterica subsp. enterica serovar Typhimurium]EBD0074792.1 hypothetical protein [Salmonella enterica subsp. enterica serovar Choleraesuis]EBF8602101.1 hypothetical protein [Salmonella enterica subsp. enterica serovar Larochelle]EBS32850